MMYVYVVVCLTQAQTACQSGGPQSQPVLFDMINTFQMMPSSGHLKPGERVNVQVKFTPAAEVAVIMSLWASLH